MQGPKTEIGDHSKRGYAKTIWRSGTLILLFGVALPKPYHNACSGKVGNRIALMLSSANTCLSPAGLTMIYTESNNPDFGPRCSLPGAPERKILRAHLSLSRPCKREPRCTLHVDFAMTSAWRTTFLMMASSPKKSPALRIQSTRTN